MRQFTDEDLVQLRLIGSRDATNLLVSDLAQALAAERLERDLAKGLLRDALDLLGSARCVHPDPGLKRSWGQRRRYLRDSADRGLDVRS